MFWAKIYCMELTFATKRKGVTAHAITSACRNTVVAN